MLYEHSHEFENGKCELCGEEEPHIMRWENRWTIAIYEADRAYGGPEEGGWWYDTGNLVRLVSIEKNEHKAYVKAARMNHLFRLVHNKRNNRFSMAYRGGDFDFMVYAGLPPEHFPKERPHYE